MHNANSSISIQSILIFKKQNKFLIIKKKKEKKKNNKRTCTSIQLGYIPISNAREFLYQFPTVQKFTFFFFFLFNFN